MPCFFFRSRAVRVYSALTKRKKAIFARKSPSCWALSHPTNPAAFYTLYLNGLCEISPMNSVATLSAVDFHTVFRALVEHIEQAYSLRVNVGPVTGSYTGQFN